MANLKNNFRVDLLFPDDYKDFIAEIYYEDKFLCLISQDDGFDNLEMELATNLGRDKIKVPLDDFQEIVNYAKQRLFDLRKT